MGVMLGWVQDSSLTSVAALCSTGQGLPVRETLQTMYKIQRDKTVVEAIVFTTFCFVFFFIVNSVNDIDTMYSTNNALFESFVDTPWPEYVVAGVYNSRCLVWHRTCEYVLPVQTSTFDIVSCSTMSQLHATAAATTKFPPPSGFDSTCFNRR